MSVADWSVPLVIGAAALLAAVAAFFFRPDKPVFPIVLALIGVILCGAQEVTAKLPGGTTVEITGKLAASSDANYQQIQLQQAAIDKLGQSLVTVQSALQQLTDNIKAQAAHTGTPAPATAAPELQRLDASRIDLDILLGRSKAASSQAMIANRDLRAAVTRLPEH